MYVIKKDGTREDFNVEKIIAAVNKSAARILYNLRMRKLISCVSPQRKRRSPWGNRNHYSGDAQYRGGGAG